MTHVVFEARALEFILHITFLKPKQLIFKNIHSVVDTNALLLHISNFRITFKVGLRYAGHHRELQKILSIIFVFSIMTKGYHVAYMFKYKYNTFA